MSHKAPDGRIEYFSTIVRDISERKKGEEDRLEMERKFLHAQKLESLGLLAGGVAHDFNNLLVGILGSLDLALLDLPPNSQARPRVETAVKASRRAADITRQMLAYSGKGQFVIQDLDLSELVEENVSIIESAISKKVTFKLHLNRDLPCIKGDPGQMQQVIMNLLTNASEAIDDKPGEITLSTGLIEARHEYLSLSRIEEKPKEGQFVYIEVSDKGCGMDEETMQRLFDPFFSTKFAGRGLGMSAVQGIVQGHKGALMVNSEKGKGTRVRVLFPILDSSPPKRAQIKFSEKGMEDSRYITPAFKGTILIVDDEEVVRSTCASMVERLGFKAITANDGEEGLRVFKDHIDEIVCVVLDLTMPKIDGQNAFNKLRKINPNIKIILSSGYNKQEATQTFIGKGLSGFIQKPYQVERLKAELENILK